MRDVASSLWVDKENWSLVVESGYTSLSAYGS